MEALLILLFAIPVLALVGAVLGALAFKRVRALGRRIEVLEDHVRDLGGATPAPAPVKRAVGPRPPSPPVSDKPIAEVDVPIVEPPPQAAPVRAEATPPMVTDTMDAVASETPAPAPAVEPPSTPPPAHATSPPPPQSPPPPRQRINWEQWIGVRGAAVLGGIVLAFAALLFFQYSVEHGLISPTTRVIMGVVAGLAAIFASEWLRRRSQVHAANALAGAGVVILYAAIWAARTLYELIGVPPAFVLMVLVTVACGLLSARRNSLVIAILGLVGGFATPLLVASDIQQPATLFSYVLLLDVGLLWLARSRRWPALALLSLAGTAIHQGLWILAGMDETRAALGLAVLAVFAVAFMTIGRRADEDNLVWRLTRAGGVVVPFAFALHFAGRVDLGDHLTPLGALLLMLSACACWLAQRQGQPRLVQLAAGFCLGGVGLWFTQRQLSTLQIWEAVAVVAVLVALYQAYSERFPSPGANSQAVLLIATGMMAILVLAATASSTGLLWPWLGGWALLSALLTRQAIRPGRPGALLIAAIGTGSGLLLFAGSQYSQAAFPSPSLFTAVLVGAGVVFQVVALASVGSPRHRWAEHAAAAVSLLCMPALLVFYEHFVVNPLLPVGVALLLGGLIALAATRLSSGLWYFAAVAATALAHSIWTLVEHLGGRSEAYPIGVFAIQAAAVAFFTFWPALWSRAFSTARFAWVGAALAGPLWFFSLKEMWLFHFGDSAIAALPLALAALSLMAAVMAQRRSREALAARSTALAWLLAVTLCLITLAIPLQLDKEWITIGWAVNGLAVIALWRRLDHPGLKFFGLGLLAAATARLIANPQVLDYHSAGSIPVFNWLLYTYLVPAACLVGAAVILGRHDAARPRAAVGRWTGGKMSLAASACGLAAVAVVFVWINLCVADAFSASSQLTLSFDRLPARDLTTSISWAVYALVLLSLGIRMDSSALRWLSLGLLLATIIKVFLHDLGELKDLYRVASLLGLAISLILVSLAYQRFVLRKKPPAEEL